MADTFLDAIAGLSGKTAFEVYESGNNWGEIIKNAESVLGKKSKWNLLADESGNVFQIVGKNGKYVNVDSAAGAVSNYVAGNQLVTDVIKEESGALTAYTGNITSASGEVTKKGLALGASTGAKVVGGALAAFGAVATGVNWYKDNPEFWTSVSQKLLPFAYKDPTDKKWGDIFYDALVPTAVDDEGNTYIQEAVLAEMSRYMVENGYFTTEKRASISDASDLPTAFKRYEGTQFPLFTTGYYKTDSAESRPGKYFYDKFTAINGGEVTLRAIEHLSDGYTGCTCVMASENPNSLLGYGSSSNIADEPEIISQYKTSSKTVKGKTYYYTLQTRGTGNTAGLYIPSFAFFEGDFDAWIVAYIMLYGNITQKTPLDNVSYPTGNIYPSSQPLSVTYPEWYKNAQTTVNPNWKPSEPESEDNPKYITWLPLQIPDEDTPDGNTQPDTDQDTAQKGKPTPKPSVDPTTEQAINDGVLPDPNQNPSDETSDNPDPQPDPSPDPTPDPIDPDTPGKTPTPTPTPDVPGIGGGTANALWKIYNPSHSILQEFGAWLWSDNPIKLIKEIFGNNPADGIVGLHMIYVTPPIGGTANIKVGYVDSGVASPWVSQQYVTIDCGSVVIPMRYQSALDFGYTKVYCYLPFIGIVPLDSFDIIGKTVKIKYTVDILTGTVLAQISVSLGSYNAVLYTFNGSCSVEYPLTSGSRASQMLSLVTGAVGGAVVGGAGGALLGGVRGAASGADVRMSGNISGNAGAMGIRKPYIIVKRPVEVPARNYPAFYGYPANITGRLNSFSGYTRVKDVHADNISGATAEEKREIESLLKAGVIV